MKKLILFISIFAITLSGKGQDTNALFESISNPNAKITETVKLIDEYLNRPLDGEPLDTEGVEKHLINWKKFWIASVGSDYTPFSGLQSLNSALSGSYSCNSEPTWQSRGPIVNPKYSNGTSISGGLMGRVSAIAATASNQTIYAGVSFSGLFKSTNGGSTWANVTDGLNRIGLAVRTIAIDPNNNNTVLCGTGILAYSMGNYTNGYSQQIIRSTDAGNTWQQITLKTLTNQVEGYGYVNSIVFDVNNIGRVYASVDEEIYLSTDHGASWFKLLIPGAFSTRRISDMVIDPSTGHLWVGVDDKDFNQGGAGLYEIEPNYVANTSGGYSWTGIITQRTPLQVIGKYNLCSVEYSPSTLNKIYTIYDIGDTTTIVQQPTNSSIASRIYTHITTNFTFEKLEFEVSPSNADVMYFGGIWLQVSIDGGNNLTNTNSSTHDDIRALEILQAQNTSNGNTDVVLVGHDGGISITHDGFGTNSILNGVGLNIMEIWNASALGNNGEYIIGAHDNGTLKFHPEYNEWRQRRGNDGGAVTKDDINNPYIVYGGGNSGTQGYVHLSTDRGNNFTRTGLKLGGWGEDSFIKSYTENRIFFLVKGKDTLMSHSFSSSHTQLVFNTRNTIRRWGDIVDFELSKDVNYPGLGFLAVSWPENSNLDSSSIVCLELDPSNNYSLNNWYDITAGLLADQKAAITDIEIDHGNVIYVSFGNFYEIGGQAQKVYKGLWDEFSKSMSWTNVSYNLPNVPFRALKIPRGSNYIYAASDAGIYYKKLTDTQWSCFGTGLPKTVIHSLSVDECKNELIASTFGRGVWTAPLLDVVEAENEYAYRFQTINTNTEITKNIIVGSNVILYITGTPANPIELNFASNTSIIIESGGEVEISYATLTNRCDAMWPGIIVKGDPSVNQIQYRNRQGRLTMLNSTVENSRYGVTVASNPKNLDQNIGTGGIISLSNVLFKNNFRSIQFGAYDYNYHNGKIFQNMSSIVNCDFVIDDDYRLYNSNKALIAANSPEIQPVHISYNKVRNVNTSNNTFTTQLLPTSSIPKANLGIGVYSVDSDVDIRNVLPLNCART